MRLDESSRAIIATGRFPFIRAAMRPSAVMPWLLGLATALAIAAIAWIVARNVAQTRAILEDATRVSTTLEVQRQLDEVLLRATEAETGQRGFILTGDDRDLQVYDRASAAIPLSIDRLETLTADSHSQRARLPRLRHAVEAKLTTLATAIERRKSGGFAAGLVELRRAEGELQMDAIRGLVTEMEREEADNLRTRRAETEAGYRRARAGRIGSGILSGLLLAGLALFAIVLGRVRESAARRVAADREHLSVTLASIGDGIIATDVDGRVTLVNSVGEGLTGCRAEHAIGQPFGDVFALVDETTGAPIAHPLATALETGETHRAPANTRLMGVTGQGHPIDASAAPIRSADGTPRGAVVVFRDVSGTRAHEAALAESQARYRDAAAEAQAARAEAEQANRLKDEFLAVLSHELRTPLNAVLGWSQILLAGEAAPATVGRGLASIKRNAEAQQRLVEDLLDVSRIVTGKFPIERKPSVLRTVIVSAVDAIGPMAAGKRVALDADLADGAIVDADPYRLQQVATNLLSNAIKFTPAGGRVTVKLAVTAATAVLSVTDTGQGIAAELLPHIFDRFRQGDGSSTRAHGGLGLGLAIARYIVLAHGGHISADSAGEGHGATFTVTLPVMDTSAMPKAFRAGRSAYEGGGGGRLRGRLVLVVDDEPDARELMSWALQEAGADVVVAADGVEALGLLSADRPDIVLTDVHMPRMDGFGLIGAMRERLIGSIPPAIAISARAASDDARRVTDAGFAAHLTKPVDLNLLLDTIDRVMTV